MNRVTTILLTGGTAVFVALLAWQGFGSVLDTLMAVGWGIAPVIALHLVSLALDAGAIDVLFDRRRTRTSLRDALIARWAGESVNSLLPAGQLGGPVMMVRLLNQRGAPMRDAAANITVSTTMQALAQIVFALVGLALFGVYAAHDEAVALRVPTLIATSVLSVFIVSFYWAQRYGMFGRVVRLASKLLGRRDWSSLTTQADDIDAAVGSMYRDHARVAATFAFSLLAWFVGTGEVWLALRFFGHPVDWLDALLLESIGQCIRSAAFAIPGALGAQEGGYLLLASLIGLPPSAALALSLVKRIREIALGVPGIVYLHASEKKWQRRVRSDAALPVAD